MSDRKADVPSSTWMMKFGLKGQRSVCVCVCVSQHLSISNSSTQVDASFMQTLWNIQPTCSSGNMAVGEEAPPVVHPRAFTLDAPAFTTFN